MSLDWNLKSACCALGTVIALAATAAFANDFGSQTSVQLAADNSETAAQAPGSATPLGYPPLEAGVRRAAAQGPEALRRYIWRTRMIYNYNFWYFVKQD
jgi:hypothetical protein